jgi:hypothetical protein
MAFFTAAPLVEIAEATRPVSPIGGDAITRIYGCTGCAAGESAEFELRVLTPYFSDTDIVVF